MERAKDNTAGLEKRVSEIMGGVIGAESKERFRLLVGISGGADSVALLVSLLRTGHKVEAMHCNFHLRGEESERDRRFVESLCSRLGVKLTVVGFDVVRYREEHQLSVEEACRNLRYDAFTRYCENHGCRRVAVAHNSDDNAETVLMNLFRGAGVSGLRGMRVDTGTVVRPLLGVSRSEIEDYLRDKNVDYVVDSSNLESLYSRNFVRNEVLPLIEKKWPSARKAINSAARIMTHTERLIEEYDSLDAIDTDFVPTDRLTEDEIGLRRIYRMVHHHGGESWIAGDVMRLLSSRRTKSGKRWSVSEGEIVMSSRGLEFVKRKETTEENGIEDGRFECERFDNCGEILNDIRKDRSNHALCVPFGANRILFRKRREGDRIRPLGMSGSRLVSDVVSDAKLPAARKADVIVAEDRETGEILWVEDLCRSRKCLILPENKSIWKFVRKI